MITRVLKHGFEPLNCSDTHFLMTFYSKKKNMDARRSRTIKIGQSRRKNRTYRPTTSTYLVDLLEQQPATICSEKGKTQFYHSKPGFTPHAWKNTVLEGEGIYIYICIYIHLFIYVHIPVVYIITLVHSTYIITLVPYPTHVFTIYWLCVSSTIVFYIPMLPILSIELDAGVLAAAAGYAPMALRHRQLWSQTPKACAFPGDAG